MFGEVRGDGNYPDTGGGVSLYRAPVRIQDTQVEVRTIVVATPYGYHRRLFQSRELVLDLFTGSEAALKQL